MSAAPRHDGELEERLSGPQPHATRALAAHPGDILVLGAGGKMGPSLCRMLVRTAAALDDGRRIIAVSRFSSPGLARRLEGDGVHVIEADLGDFDAHWDLPDAPNVIYMAGRKFGTAQTSGLTWHANTVVPSMVANRFASSRIVAFSTGNVYGLTPVAGGGSLETDMLAPVGDYAASCVGRERVFEYASATNGTPVAVVRLNYAVDLRYGVLVDLAQRVLRGDVIDLRMGHVNCIWQGDANAIAIALLDSASCPPFVLNVTGVDMLSVRSVAGFFGRRFARSPRFDGDEAPDALLSNTGRMQQLFGAPSISAATLQDWVATWVERGGSTLGRETHFAEREGVF